MAINLNHSKQEVGETRSTISNGVICGRIHITDGIASAATKEPVVTIHQAELETFMNWGEFGPMSFSNGSRYRTAEARTDLTKFQFRVIKQVFYFNIHVPAGNIKLALDGPMPLLSSPCLSNIVSSVSLLVWKLVCSGFAGRF